MMNSPSPITIVQDAEALLRLVTETYQTYLDGLETFTKTIPDSETEALSELFSHIQDVQKSMEHDLALFDKAVFADKESLHHLREQLKINALHELLFKNQ